MNPSNIASQAGPSASAWRAELGDVPLERRREERGSSRPGTPCRWGGRCSGTRRPRRSSSSSSSAYAGEPVKSGCQEASTSCVKPGSGEVGRRLDAAAELVVPLEDADAPAGLREQRRTRERVDPGADEDRIESRHRARLYQRGTSLDMSRRRVTESPHAPARGRVRAPVHRRRGDRAPRGRTTARGRSPAARRSST